MGAWEELDREITATKDTGELENLILDLQADSDLADIFEPALKICEGYKEAIEEGTETGLEIIANRLMAEERFEILDTGKHPYSQGILGTSITAEQRGEGWLIGTTINDIYPMSVEYGADIYPKTKQFLKFQTLDGDIVYAREVHQKPKPYVEPAWQHTIELIEGEGYGVFREVCKLMDNVGD